MYHLMIPTFVLLLVQIQSGNAEHQSGNGLANGSAASKREREKPGSGRPRKKNRRLDLEDLGCQLISQHIQRMV